MGLLDSAFGGGSPVANLGGGWGGGLSGAINNGPAGGGAPIMNFSPQAMQGGNWWNALGSNMAGMNPFSNSDNWGRNIANAVHGPGMPGLKDIPVPTAPQQVNAPQMIETPKMQAGSAAAPTNMAAASAAAPSSMNGATVGPYNQMQSFGGDVSGAGGANAAGQSNLASLLSQQASGQGPSIAGMQLQQGQQANMAQQFAMANSARGGAQASALRGAMNNVGQMNGDLSQQSAMARLAEQQQAAGTLGNVLQGARGQDIQQAVNAAQLNQGASQFNAGNSFNAAMANAGFAQGANQQNYMGNLQTNLANAGFAQQANQQNYQGNLQTNLTNAGFQQGANQQNYQGGLQTNLANQSAGLQGMLANQKAGLTYNDQLMQQAQIQNAQMMQRWGAQNAQFGNMMNMGGGALSFLSHFLGAGGGAAAGGADTGAMAGGDAADVGSIAATA